MIHVLFLRDRSVSEADGIRKEVCSFGIAFERVSIIPFDDIDNRFEERVLEMKEHPAHKPINRYLPKTNKIQ